jgi:hypothetical protein
MRTKTIALDIGRANVVSGPWLAKSPVERGPQTRARLKIENNREKHR